MVKKHVLAEARSPSGKAAALLAGGAYSQYVSTAQGRERRWRLFSTFPAGDFLRGIRQIARNGMIAMDRPARSLSEISDHDEVVLV